MPDPLAIYMPCVRAVLLQVGDGRIELAAERAGRLVTLLGWLATAPNATISLGGAAGRIKILPHQARPVAAAIEAALATRDLATDLPADA